MSEKRQPWGHVSAVIDRSNGDRDRKTRFLRLGAIWETENGNLTATLELSPVEWGDPMFERRIVILKRDDDDRGDGNRGSRNNRRDRGNDDTSNRSNKR